MQLFKHTVAHAASHVPLMKHLVLTFGALLVSVRPPATCGVPGNVVDTATCFGLIHNWYEMLVPIHRPGIGANINPACSRRVMLGRRADSLRSAIHYHNLLETQQHSVGDCVSDR